MVNLAHHRDSVAGEAVNQVQLPQRPGAVQRPGVDARHLLGQLSVGPRRRQGDLANVELEVEVRVVDPVGVVEVERHLRQPPPERRHEGEPLGDQALESWQRQLAVRGG